MKHRFSVLGLLVAYYCFTTIFVFWRIDHLVKDLLVAPVYIVVPTGIGLLVLSINGMQRRLLDWLSKPQILLSGCFIGFVAVTLAYQELERQNALRSVFTWVYPALLGASLLGYYRSRELLAVDPDSLRKGSRALLWLLPAAAVAYYFHYVHFASFPLRDIFQQTHFMKGALELSQVQILNPYITGSYLPYIQLQLGLLHHFYGFDLFRAQWILPLSIFFLNLSCYAVFISSVTRDRAAQLIALLLMIMLAPVFQLENMIMQESMMLVLLSMLLRMDVEGNAAASFKTNVMVLAVLFIAYHFYFDYYYSPPATDVNQPPAHYTSMWVFALLVFFIFSSLRERGVHIVAFIILFAVSAFAVHRAILLFMPIILFIYVVHHLIHRPQLMLAMKKRLPAPARMGASVVVALLVAFIYWNSGASDIPVKQGDDNAAAASIAGYLLRTPVFVGGGTGIFHSLVEYLRLLPPLAHLLIFIFFLQFVLARREQPAVLSPQSGYTPSSAGVSTWLFIVTLPVLIVVVLSTIPYVYRGSFFPMMLGISLLAVLGARFLQIKESGSRIVRGAVAAVTVTYLVAAATFWYGTGSSFLGAKNTYLEALSPFSWTLAVTALAGVGAMVLGQKQGRTQVVGFTVAIVSALAFDAFSFRTLFYEKAFRDRLPDSGIISHYTKLELSLADKLRQAPVKTILVSDPYTLSILRAATGFNSVYSFANINIVTYPQRYKDIFQYLQSLEGVPFSSDKAARLVVMADQIRKTAAAEGMYIWNRIRPDNAGDLVTLDAFYDNFIWILSAKTLSWAEGRDGYYPDNTPLPASLVESLRSYFDIEINMDGRLLAMKLKRHESLRAPSSLLKKAQQCACPE